MSERTAASQTRRTPFRIYFACYVLLGALLGYALIVRWFVPVVLEDPVQVETARLAEVEQRIDPNTASGSELSRLPGVGETLARRIVDYRNQRRAGGTDVVFQRAEDLDAVRGIGPATIEKLRSHLRFPSSDDDASKR